ncbi:MAG: hypothetical protein FWF05_06005 [Oscillospiraceae bacterium]|nr:hypothetical protein [Oscillospiraceae bacterium]
MKTIYVISKWLTFPGAFMKGFFEHLTCRLLKVKIYEADKYVTNNLLSGHVYMLPPESAAKSFFVCFLPGLLNFLFGLGSYAAALMTLGYLGVGFTDAQSQTQNPMFVFYCVLLYFGASMMCNIFPYRDDISHARELLYGGESKSGGAAKVLFFIPAAVMKAGSVLERYGLTVLFNIALAAFIFICLG